MISFRPKLIAALAALAITVLARQAGAAAISAPADAPTSPALPYTPVVTLNGSTLPWKMDHGVKVFHLVAEPIKHEFAPGFVVNCWGYNGQTPGPTIEAVEGDRVRIYVTNHLPEPTSVHWHGVFLPNGEDGVGGLTQPHIQPGETWEYEFTLHQVGTQMYHPHSDEMVQMAMGMYGFFIIHPKKPEVPHVDRDFAIFLGEWAIDPGTHTPNTNIMTDFNTFTFNNKVYPATEPLVVQTGQLVRVRIANLTMDSHPIHLHGYSFHITATDGGPIPVNRQWPDTTVNVPVGSTRDIEFVANAPGDWAFHCHKSHHTMNAMSHDIANLMGVDQTGLAQKISALVPGYMPMGGTGMGGMQAMSEMMPGPANTEPMMTGQGKYGPIEMGGMFTVLKVRNHLTSYKDPGWYNPPPGTKAKLVSVDPKWALSSPATMSHMAASGAHVYYTCPMHPQIMRDKPGHCPICGMTLVKKTR